jgi:DNA mismatch repair protein MSH4
MQNENNFLEITNLISNIHDIEHLLTKFVYTPKNVDLKSSKSIISNIIGLKMTLKSLTPLSNLLGEYSTDLIKAINSTLIHEDIENIQFEIEKVVDENVVYSKNTINKQTQECFAVKPGIDGFLDVARKQVYFN